jgi:hypothetical protein
MYNSDITFPWGHKNAVSKCEPIPRSVGLLSPGHGALCGCRWKRTARSGVCLRMYSISSSRQSARGRFFIVAVKYGVLRNVTHGLEIWRVVWIDLSSGKWARYLECVPICDAVKYSRCLPTFRSHVPFHHHGRRVSQARKKQALSWELLRGLYSRRQ